MLPLDVIEMILTQADIQTVLDARLLTKAMGTVAQKLVMRIIRARGRLSLHWDAYGTRLSNAGTITEAGDGGLCFTSDAWPRFPVSVFLDCTFVYFALCVDNVFIASWMSCLEKTRTRGCAKYVDGHVTVWYECDLYREDTGLEWVLHVDKVKLSQELLRAIVWASCRSRAELTEHHRGRRCVNIIN